MRRSCARHDGRYAAAPATPRWLPVLAQGATTCDLACRLLSRAYMMRFFDRLAAPGAPRVHAELPFRISDSFDARELRRLRGVRVSDAGHGYDAFGMHPDWVAVAIWMTRFAHDSWFRVTAHGAENLPAHGRAIIAANHSGGLPIDASMLYANVVAHTQPPRAPRPIADRFVPALPFVSTLYARIGVVNGTRENVARLLEDEELLMIFPEGAAGLGKPRAQKYKLAPFRVGHAELAIRHRAPVIPVAIIGAEEQFPLLTCLTGLHPFGAPYVPISPLPLPLPVHYHIHYGAPLHLADGVTDPDDPMVIAAAAERVRTAVQALIEEGLRMRTGVFS